MKKSLLLSLALVPASVFALNVNVNHQVKAPEGLDLVKCADFAKALNTPAKAMFNPAQSFNVAPKAKVSAGYLMPTGTTYWGWGTKANDTTGGIYSYSLSLGFLPAYTNLTWYNVNANGTNQWTYYTGEASDGSSYVSGTSTDVDLVTPGIEPFTMLPNPEVKTTIDGKSDSYTYGDYSLYGGLPYMSSATFRTFPDDWYSLKTDGAGESYTVFFGAYNDGTYKTSTQVASAFGLTGKNPQVTSLYQLYAPSPTGYCIESVSLKAYCTKFTSERLEAKIWSVNSNGQMDSVIAEGYIDGSEVSTSENNYVVVDIPFYETDGQLTEQVLAEIPANTTIAVQVTGFDETKDNIVVPAVFSNGQLDDSAYTFSSIGITYDGTSGRTEGIVDAGALTFGSSESDYCYAAMLNIGLVQYNPYITVSDDEFIFDQDGGTKTVDVDCLFNSEYITLDGEGVDDWWSYSFGDADETTGTTPLEITTASLPSDVHRRFAQINMSTYAVSTVLYLLQDDGSSVNSLSATSTSAKVVNGNFEVASDNATAVAVYNLAGQKVAEAAFEGNTTINAADLAKGVYVLKFNNNAVVKLAK